MPKKTTKKQGGWGGPRENTGGARDGAGAPSKRGGPTCMLNVRVLVSTRERLKAEAEGAGKSLSTYVADWIEGKGAPAKD